MHEFIIMVFAIAAGFTASGIVASLYRMVAKKPEGAVGRTVYIVVMVFAGPSVLVGNAAKSLHAKGCSRFAFWLAAAVAGYWSFAIGLFVLSISLAI